MRVLSAPPRARIKVVGFSGAALLMIMFCRGGGNPINIGFKNRYRGYELRGHEAEALVLERWDM